MGEALTPPGAAPAQSVAATPIWPIDTLELVLQACNPGTPLQRWDTRYVDLTPLRQNKGIKPIERRLRMVTAPGDFHHCLLCGHRGSGKSTELLALQEWAENEGFLAVWTEVNEKFGMIELDYSDLFLLAAVETEKAMQRFGHSLPPAKIRRVIEWFRDITREDTQEAKSEIGVEVAAQLEANVPRECYALLSKGAAFASIRMANTTKCKATNVSGRRS